MIPHLAPFHGRLMDYPVVVTAPDPEAQAAIRSVLQGFATRVPSADAVSYVVRRDERDRWCLEADLARVCEGHTLADVLVALEWRLVTDMLARGRHGFHLHGAALGTPSGQASVLVVGASGAGKTTLTLALMGRGFLPFSDDVVLIDPRRLTPATFRRAFHTDPATRALIGSHPECRFDGMPPGYAVPLSWAEHPAPVRTILFATLRPQAVPAVTRLSVGDAAIALLRFSLTLESAPELALAVAARLTARATSYTLSVGDLDATADLVTEVTERDALAPARDPAGRRDRQRVPKSAP